MVAVLRSPLCCCRTSGATNPGVPQGEEAKRWVVSKPPRGGPGEPANARAVESSWLANRDATGTSFRCVRTEDARLREAEIDELDKTFCVEEDVLWLQIAVDDACFVHGL